MEGEKLTCYVCERLKEESEFSLLLGTDWICKACEEKWASDMIMGDYLQLRYENLKMKRCIRQIQDEIEDI